jgi:hypothetical protein
LHERIENVLSEPGNDYSHTAWDKIKYGIIYAFTGMNTSNE